MDIMPFITGLRRDLAQAAEAAGPEQRAAAEHILLALEPSVRLAAMELLAQAAAEVTADLPTGTVEVRLRGRDPELVVSVPALRAEPAHDRVDPQSDESLEKTDDGPVARVTLRLPEAVKVRAEERAARGGVSLNAWIVTALRRATSDHAMTVDVDLSSVPFVAGAPAGQRLKGWI